MSAVAARFAAEVDRVAHLALPALGASPELAELATRHDVPPRNVLVPMGLVLGHRSMTQADAELLFRYRAPDVVRGWLEGMCDDGLLFRVGEGDEVRLWPTPRAAAYLDGLLALQDRLLAEVVPDAPTHERARSAFQGLVDQIADSGDPAERPGFELTRHAPEGTGTAAARLARRASAFRHLRADAHAAALRAAGIPLALAGTLNALWRADGPLVADGRITQESLDELVAADLAEHVAAGVVLTAEVAATRSAAEADTDVRHLQLLGGDPARVESVMAELVSVATG